MCVLIEFSVLWMYLCGAFVYGLCCLVVCCDVICGVVCVVVQVVVLCWVLVLGVCV